MKPHGVIRWVLTFSFVLIAGALLGAHPSPATTFGSGVDSDRDGVFDIAEMNCGSDANNSRRRPERLDDVFAGRDENGNGQTDEALPAGASPYDCDGDGYTGATEDHVFDTTARDQDACGTTAWPSDLASGGTPTSTNRLTVSDITSFVAPDRHFNTSPPSDPLYDPRWDLLPGPGLLDAYINIQDIIAIIASETGHPSMFEGARAFDGKLCPWPLTAGWDTPTALPNSAFSRPVSLVPIPGKPDEAVVLLQKEEKIYRISLSGAFQPVLFADMSALVGGAGSEEGLLSLAFPPGFPDDDRAYVCYSQGSPSPKVLARFTVANDQMVVGSKEELLLIPQPDPIHNCGQMLFGPTDGYLYLSVGDGGPGGDPQNTGLNNTDLLGSVLRLDVSGETGYAAPASNPFISGPGNDLVWAYGFRNPWRWSFDSESHEMWLGDVGQAAWEEVSKVISGGNYGWSCYEGSAFFAPARCGAGPYQFPRAVFDHVTGCAVIGGWVYHGSLHPELAGWLVYADHCSGKIFAVNTADSTSPPVQLFDAPFSIMSIGQLQSGELVMLGEVEGIYTLLRN